MRENPKPQEIFRHFKGKTYKIVTLATDSETGEDMVVYQAQYGDFKTYVRDLDMFMSEVDLNKYPNATQKYRFERVSAEGDETIDTQIPKVSPVSAPDDSISAVRSGKGYTRPADVEPRKSTIMDKTVDEEAKELNLDPLVIEFMDADLAVEKNEILSRLRPTITNDMIDIMAMSLGVVIEAGDVYDRFNDLRTCLNTIEKFESTRLRG